MMSRKKTAGILLAAAGLVLAGVLVIYRDTVRMVFHNLYSPKVELDESESWEGGASYEGLQYSEVSESDYMNLYVPEGEEPMPLLVLVHGGGFVANDCESRQAQLMYRYFRDQGYACASVNYRLAQEAAYPAALEDVKAAVRFLRANADEYGYDGDRIAIWGESAGGYLAVMAGVTSDEEFTGVPFVGEKEDGKVSGQVQAILDFYGVMDFGQMKQDFAQVNVPGLVQWFANLWLADALKEYEEYDSVEELWLRRDMDGMSGEELRQYLPEYYIEKNLSGERGPSVLIWHGDADITVPYVQSERLREQLEEILGPERVDYQLFHNYMHAADAFYSDEALGKIREYLDKTLKNS